jgi:rod shape determining protein RodA
MTLGDLTRRPDGSRRSLADTWQSVDAILVVCVLALAGLGLVMVYSATRGAEPPYDQSFVVRQALFVAIGLVAMGVVALFDYRRIRDWAWVPFGASIVMLLAVISPLGSNIKGSQRWFSVGPFTLQPSEFTKVALIIIVAAMLAGWSGQVDVPRLVRVLVVAAVPMVLVLAQPDLGTVLAYMGIVVAMLLVGGVRARYLLVLLAMGLLLSTAVITSDTLASYQRDRLTSFIDPASDSQGITYNQNQSVTAVASGGLLGQGLFEGPQTQLRFVPEQETDFIFTVVTEELGFVGGVLVLGLYGVLCWRMWRIAQQSRDLFGTLLASGVLIIFVFQIFANVGMATGIMPVTGITLPFVSYGGSSILTMMVAAGLTLSVGVRRFS